MLMPIVHKISCYYDKYFLINYIREFKTVKDELIWLYAAHVAHNNKTWNIAR